MQIYANLLKINKKCHLSSIHEQLMPFHRSALPAGTYITHRVIY